MPTKTRLVLVRHGQTTWNVTHRLTSRTDVPLTDLGRDQARAMGEALGRTVIFDAAFTSPRIRARDTAQIILEAADSSTPLTLDERLIEVDCGPFEGLTEAEMRQPPFAADVRAWRTGDLVPDGCEPDEAGVVRARSFLDEVAPHGGTVLAVTHGQLLRVLLASAVLGLPARGNVHRIKIVNCRAAVVELRPGGSPRLLALNTLEV